MSDSGRRTRRWITNVALLLGVVVFAVFTTKAGFAWAQMKKHLAGLQAEKETLAAQNETLRPLHVDVRGPDGTGKFVKLCNASQDPVEVDWVYASYPSGDHMAVFDSRKCTDWQKINVEGGKSAQLSLNSAQPGCNWNGQVVFYSMSFVRHRPDRDDAETVGGPWLNFDQDCFTFRP